MRMIDADALCLYMYNWQYATAPSDRTDNTYKRYTMKEVRVMLYDTIGEAMMCVDEAPTVDAQPVRHGKWIKIHPQGIYECSECRQNVMTSDIECYRYCHHCGAKMDRKGMAE